MSTAPFDGPTNYLSARARAQASNQVIDETMTQPFAAPNAMDECRWPTCGGTRSKSVFARLRCYCAAYVACGQTRTKPAASARACAPSPSPRGLSELARQPPAAVTSDAALLYPVPSARSQPRALRAGVLAPSGSGILRLRRAGGQMPPGQAGAAKPRSASGIHVRLSSWHRIADPR